MTYSFETVNLLRERGEVVPDGVAEIPTSELWAKLREANVGGGVDRPRGTGPHPSPNPFVRSSKKKCRNSPNFPCFGA